MSNHIVISPMNKSDARACIAAIKRDLMMAGLRAVEFRDRLGWKALGYDSLATCFEVELGYSFQHGYRLLKAAEIAQEISPLGENLPERHARELAKLPTGDARREAYETAQQIAAGEGDKPLATRHVEQGVKVVAAKMRVMGSKYFPIAQMMTTGEVAPLVAQAMVESVDRLPPKKRGYIMQLIAGSGLTCAELIAPLAGMFDRPPGQESYVLPEVLAAGTLGGTPLKQATLTDLERANEEARLRHIADAEEARREAREDWKIEPVPVNITVWLGDRTRTMRQIDTLGEPAVAMLRQWLMEE